MKISILSLLLLCVQASASIGESANPSFIEQVRGDKILFNIDLAIENNRLSRWAIIDFIFGSDTPKTPLEVLKAETPQLESVWRATTMVFGASPDGIGVGTAFAFKNIENGKLVFVTNLHAVEKFCRLSDNLDSDFDTNGDKRYYCQALFVLHDISINIQTNQANVDGPNPWKAEVLSLDYFDKKNDLAVFQIELPPGENIQAVMLENSLDFASLLVPNLSAQRIPEPRVLPSYEDPSYSKFGSRSTPPPIQPTLINGVSMLPLTKLSVYLVAISVPGSKSDNNSEDRNWIKKRWFKGLVEGMEPFENDRKLGFVNAIRHDMEILPGTSGGAIALSDGRVVGVNSSVEIKQFYARSWWFGSYNLETYRSYFAMPSVYLRECLGKIN